MTDDELMERAARSGYNYRRVYGVFPDTIGIHWQRLKRMTQTCIMFPDPPTVTSQLYLVTDMDASSVRSCIHRTALEPLKDREDMDYDEVYVPVPELPDGQQRLRSGEALARMARSEYEVGNEYIQ